MRIAYIREAYGAPQRCQNGRNYSRCSRRQIPRPYYRKAGVLYFEGAGSPPEAINIGVTTYQHLLRLLRAIHGTNHRDPVLLGIVPFTYGQTPMMDAERYQAELHEHFASIQLRKP